MSVSHIKKSIIFSKKISSKLYTFHPGFLTDPDGSNISQKNYDFLWNKKKLLTKNYEKSWKLMISSIKEIVKFNKEAGLLENDYDDFLESSFQVEEALEGFNLDNLVNKLPNIEIEYPTVSKKAMIFLIIKLAHLSKKLTHKLIQKKL